MKHLKTVTVKKASSVGDEIINFFQSIWEEVAGWFGKIREFAGDTIDVEPVDVLADDEHLTIFLHITAKRDDQVLDVEVANAFRVDPDGRWKESWYLPNDQAAWDRFFS